MAETIPIRVVIADVHLLFREAVASAVADNDTIEVVCRASDGHELLACAHATDPDVVWMNADLPDAMFAVEQIRERHGKCKIIMFLDGEGGSEAVVRAVEARADGFLPLGSLLPDLVEATHLVARGQKVIPAWVEGLRSRRGSPQ